MSLILSGTDGLSDIDGSAATPAIRGTDTNTGIFFPAADTIAFAEGGVESMRIDSSGNVGIGTTSPSAKLHVEGGTENAIIGSSTRKLYFRADSNGVSVLDAAAQAGNGFYVNSVSSYVATYTGSTERLRIASAGQIGIGGANYGSSGQVLTSGGSGAAPSWATVSAGYTLGTPIATTSGTTAEFTGIPSTVRQIVLSFNAISFSTGANINLAVQVSTSSTYLTSGYVGRMGTLRSTTVTPDALSTRIVISNGSFVQSGDTLTGSLTMTLLDSSTNTWSGTSMTAVNGSNKGIFITPFTFALASSLNKLKLFDNSSNTFSGGSFNIAYI
jgi:hypothetical protein